MTVRTDAFTTAIPARPDCLPGSRFPWPILVALGVKAEDCALEDVAAPLSEVQ